MIKSEFNRLEYDGTVGILAQEFASIYETLLEDAPEIIFAVTNNYSDELLTSTEGIEPSRLFTIDFVVKDYKRRNRK